MPISFENKAPEARLVIKLRRHDDRVRVTFERLDDESDVCIECPGSAAEIRAAVEDLRQQAASPRFCPSNYDGGSRDERIGLVRGLAARGHELHQSIFDARAASILEGAIEATRAAGGLPKIVVRSDTISVPWELIHPRSTLDDDEEPWSGFLGCEVLFVSRTAGEVRASATESDRSNVFEPPDDDPPLLGHVYDDLLESCSDPRLARWHAAQATRMQVDTLKALDATEDSRNEMQSDIVAFVARAHDILHFDAHARYAATETSATTTIRLRHGYWAHNRDVAAWRLTGQDDTIVILNFCDSATSCWDHDSVARRMQRNGARAVVATSSPICDAFARRFINTLHEHLLARRSVGEALHATRLDLLNATANPSALYYALHGAAVAKVAGQGGQT